MEGGYRAGMGGLAGRVSGMERRGGGLLPFVATKALHFGASASVL